MHDRASDEEGVRPLLWKGRPKGAFIHMEKASEVLCRIEWLEGLSDIAVSIQVVSLKASRVNMR